MEELKVYGPFISRKQAQKKGLKQYFPGSTCKKGHVEPRYVSGGRCIVCQRIQLAKKREEGYFLKYEANRRKTDPNWKENKNRIAKESYARHKDDPEAKEKRREKYEKNKDKDWYKEASLKAKQKFVASGKKAEADKRYAQSEFGKQSHEKARKTWQKKFEEKVGMPFSSYRLKTDPQFKLHCRLNTRVHKALERDGTVKANKTTQLVGCSIKELKDYLQAHWEKGMNWENYTKEGWHIDHIRPCASFDLTDNEQQKVCFNWRNLMPMWGQENMEKGDRYEPFDEDEWKQLMRDLGYEGELFLKYEEGNSYL